MNNKSVNGNFAMTRRNAWKVTSIILVLTLLGNCYYDVEEELYGSLGCQTENISYAQDVLPIIQNNCYSCHNQIARNGNVVLEGYANILQYATSGALVGVIKHEAGYIPMPQNLPQLVECEIAKIDQWVKDGAKNN